MNIQEFPKIHDIAGDQEPIDGLLGGLASGVGALAKGVGKVGAVVVNATAKGAVAVGKVAGKGALSLGKAGGKAATKGALSLGKASGKALTRGAYSAGKAAGRGAMSFERASLRTIGKGSKVLLRSSAKGIRAMGGRVSKMGRRVAIAGTAALAAKKAASLGRRSGRVHMSTKAIKGRSARHATRPKGRSKHERRQRHQKQHKEEEESDDDDDYHHTTTVIHHYENHDAHATNDDGHDTDATDSDYDYEDEEHQHGMSGTLTTEDTVHHHTHSGHHGHHGHHILSNAMDIEGVNHTESTDISTQPYGVKDDSKLEFENMVEVDSMEGGRDTYIFVYRSNHTPLFYRPTGTPIHTIQLYHHLGKEEFCLVDAGHNDYKHDVHPLLDSDMTVEQIADLRTLAQNYDNAPEDVKNALEYALAVKMSPA